MRYSLFLIDFVSFISYVLSDMKRLVKMFSLAESVGRLNDALSCDLGKKIYIYIYIYIYTEYLKKNETKFDML